MQDFLRQQASSSSGPQLSIPAPDPEWAGVNFLRYDPQTGMYLFNNRDPRGRSGAGSYTYGYNPSTGKWASQYHYGASATPKPPGPWETSSAPGGFYAKGFSFDRQGNLLQDGKVLSLGGGNEPANPLNPRDPGAPINPYQPGNPVNPYSPYNPYPAPPRTVIPESPDVAMEPRELPFWLSQLFPENYAYYDNLQKGLLDESVQGSRNAMDLYNTRQQEMSRLFNDQTGSLNAALAAAQRGRSAGLGSFSEAAKAGQGYLTQAMKLQDEALRSNPQKYQAYIDSGTLPGDLDANLRGIRDDSLATTRRTLDRQQAKALSALKQQASGMGMQDSDYSAGLKAQLAQAAGQTMSDAISAQNREYMRERLDLPYKMQAAATNTMSAYNPFVSNLMQGGTMASGNLQQLGTAQLKAAADQAAQQTDAFNSIMAAGDKQMQYPKDYFLMANQLPNNAIGARDSYLNTMMDIWKNLLANDATYAQIDAQRDDGGSWLDNIFGF